MKPRLIIIPGFGETAREAPYRELVRHARKKFRVSTYNPKWERRTVRNWLEGLLERIKPGEQIELLGFSFGAFLAILAAENYPLHKIYACSPSPWFKENLGAMPAPAREYLGIRRVADLATRAMPKKLLTKIHVHVGEKEIPIAFGTAHAMAKRYGGRITVIRGAGHELTPDYLHELKKALG